MLSKYSPSEGEQGAMFFQAGALCDEVLFELARKV